MGEYTGEELKEALRVVKATIKECEKMQPKFAEGTPQKTLLKNRIKALYISKALIEGENVISKYANEELEDAIHPVSSIISKCEKARLKSAEGSAHNNRLKSIIKAMYISKSFIADEMNRRK